LSPDVLRGRRTNNKFIIGRRDARVDHGSGPSAGRVGPGHQNRQKPVGRVGSGLTEAVSVTCNLLPDYNNGIAYVMNVLSMRVVSTISCTRRVGSDRVQKRVTRGELCERRGCYGRPGQTDKPMLTQTEHRILSRQRQNVTALENVLPMPTASWYHSSNCQQSAAEPLRWRMHTSALYTVTHERFAEFINVLMGSCFVTATSM